MIERRRGMALAVTIGVVALMAILAVATLSLAGRVAQMSALGLRDARLDGAVAFGLASASDQWRLRGIGRIAVGSSVSFNAAPSGVPVGATVVVTRIAPEIFWVTSEAADGGGSRRESLVLRVQVPDAASLLGDSTNVDALGFVEVDSLVAMADAQHPSGATITPGFGVVHVSGDATILGGSGSGALIVDGRATITGPLLYEGIIIAAGGISVLVSGVTVTGVVRASGTPPIAGPLSIAPNALAVQSILLQSLRPKIVDGRRWGEMH